MAEKATNGKNRNFKGKNKNRKPDFKGKRRSNDKCDRASNDNRLSRADEMGVSNDMSWYDRNPKLTLGTARVSFPYRPGMDIRPLRDQTDKPFTIPGVMRLEWAPFIGLWNDKNSTSAISLAAQDVFNKVRAAYSGSLDADSPDFMIYFMALDSCYSYIASLKRIFRTATTYSPDTYDVPNTLLRAMGLDSYNKRQEVRDKRVQLWNGINALVSAMSRFKCPAVFPIFNRHYWLNDNVYTDAPSANSQMYVMYQSKFLKFDYQTVETIQLGHLTYVTPTWREGSVVEDMIAFGWELINALAGTDDTFIISGYLRRAYEGVPDFTLDLIEYEDKLVPVYDEVVLSQIENAYTPFNDGSCSITLNGIEQKPKSNAIRTDFKMTIPETHQNAPRPFLNLHADVPSPVDIVEASRLQTIVDHYNPVGGGVSAGTEILLGLSLMWGADTVNVQNLIQHVVITSDDTVSKALQLYKLLGVLSSFDWHPPVFITDGTGTGDVACIPAFDVKNFTTLSYEDAYEINRTCMLSEFNAFSNN